MNELFFFHCPKTGGMTVGRYLGKHHRAGKIKVHHKGHTKPIFKKVLREQTSPNIKTLTAIRDPISHSVSLYRYIKGSRAHRMHKFTFARPFNTWVEEFKDLNDYYCRYYGYGDFDKAMAILKEMDYILIQENLTEDLNILAKKLRLPKFNGQKINVTRGNDVNITPALKRRIRQLRSKDYELYDFAVKNKIT